MGRNFFLNCEDVTTQLALESLGMARAFQDLQRPRGRSLGRISGLPLSGHVVTRYTPRKWDSRALSDTLGAPSLCLQSLLAPQRMRLFLLASSAFPVWVEFLSYSKLSTRETLCL